MGLNKKTRISEGVFHWVYVELPTNHLKTSGGKTVSMRKSSSILKDVSLSFLRKTPTPLWNSSHYLVWELGTLLRRNMAYLSFNSKKQRLLQFLGAAHRVDIPRCLCTAGMCAVPLTFDGVKGGSTEQFSTSRVQAGKRCREHSHLGQKLCYLGKRLSCVPGGYKTFQVFFPILLMQRSLMICQLT